MSKQSAKKVLERILHYPHKEKECSYICGPHLEPCIMVRAHDGDCECRQCRQLLLETQALSREEYDRRDI